MKPKIPYSLEAEQNLIGSIVLDNKLLSEITDLITHSHFFKSEHALIFAAVCDLIRTTGRCDLITLSESLKRQGKLEEAGGFSAVGSIVNDTASTFNAMQYAKIIRDHADRRTLMAVASDIFNNSAHEPIEQVRARLSTALADLDSGNGQQVMTWGDAIQAAGQRMEAAKARYMAGQAAGIPLGLPCLDHATGGIGDGQIAIIAARPGTGKSALLTQAATYASSRGHGGIVFSLEMGADELAIRAMANAAQVNVSKLFRGFTGEIEQGMDAVVNQNDLPLWIDTNTRTLDGICARIASMKARHNIQWAAIDHIGLIQTQRFSSRNDQIGAITGQLKGLALRLKMPLILLSQMSRNSEKEDRRPMLSDLRDSGNIEQDADIVIFLHRENKPDTDRLETPISIGILKNRNGRGGYWLNQKVMFYGQTQTFREIAEQ